MKGGGLRSTKQGQSGLTFLHLPVRDTFSPEAFAARGAQEHSEALTVKCHATSKASADGAALNRRPLALGLAPRGSQGLNPAGGAPAARCGAELRSARGAGPGGAGLTFRAWPRPGWARVVSPPFLTPSLRCSKMASAPWSKARSKRTAPRMMVRAKVEVRRNSALYACRSSAILPARSAHAPAGGAGSGAARSLLGDVGGAAPPRGASGGCRPRSRQPPRGLGPRPGGR